MSILGNMPEFEKADIFEGSITKAEK